MIREVYRQSTFNWILGLVALLLPLSLGACWSVPSSPLSAEHRHGITERDDARLVGGESLPLVFTVRTDTAEASIAIYRAQGAGVIHITDPEVVKAGDANCSLFAVSRYGLNPSQGWFAGVLAVNLEDPAVEPVYACVLDKTFSKAAMEHVASRMKPPRSVISYNPDKRTVTFGPVQGQSANALTDEEIQALVQVSALMQRAYLDALVAAGY